MPFRDRTEAGRQLAGALARLRGDDLAVLGLARGGVRVAAEVARALRAPLDVIVVRKLGVPARPALAMGVIADGGVRLLNPHAVGVSGEEIAAVERRERAELAGSAARLRAGRPPVAVRGRVAVVVDDGIATGATARAACQAARAQGAARVVLAVPVAPQSARVLLAGDADEVVCLEMPASFAAIGEWYDDFSEISDERVMELLARAWPVAGAGQPGAGRAALPEPGVPAGVDVTVLADGAELAGRLTVPRPGAPVVVFAYGSGSGRHDSRNRLVVSVLTRAGLATLRLDLLTPAEGEDPANVFDLGLLARRLGGISRWLRGELACAATPIGFFGAGLGAGAASLWAAAEPGSMVAAVVCRGGRPDLAVPRLGWVRAPTLLIVGGEDGAALAANRQVHRHLRCERELAVLPAATHPLADPGTVKQVAGLTRDWFTRHLIQDHARA